MWIRFLALAVAALFLAFPAYVFSPVLGGSLIIVAGSASIAAIAYGVGPRLRRDAYDLAELKRVHEEEELRALDPEAAMGDPESVICPRCMTEYPARLGACPRCGVSG